MLAITAFAGGTSFVGALIARKRNFSEQQVLFFTAFGAGILMAAAVFEMVIEAETELGINKSHIATSLQKKKVVELGYCLVSD